MLTPPNFPLTINTMTDSLYIIDGHAQIYRAYYAVLGLTSPAGEPTNATFGFCGMLLKLIQSRHPSHVLMAVDAGAAARLAMDANYKAQRKPMPEDMPVQIDRICQIVELAGIPIYRHEGCEADDVIATLVCKIRQDPARRDTAIYMCTKDKDLDQLISPTVRMYDIQTDEELDPEALRAKKGYGPEQARDVLALTGDAVDNIPGIPGVGPKTAAKWIAEYGSLDNLLANKEKIKGKIGETFRNSLPILEQSRRLVELICDVPVEMNWDAAQLRPEKWAALAPIFQELGFTRLLAQLGQIVQAHRTAATPPKTPVISTRKTASTSRAEAMDLFSSLPASSATAGERAKETTSSPQTTPAASAEAPADCLLAPTTLEPHVAAVPAAAPSPAGLSPVVGDYRLVNTPATLEAMLADLRRTLAEVAAEEEGKEGILPPVLAVDTETDALGAMCSNLCGISLCARDGISYYIAVKGVGEVIDPVLLRDRLGPLLSDPAIRKVGQNLKYDINSLRNFGLNLRGIFLDTMVASYVLDSSRLSHSMDALAADLLGLRPIPITDLIGTGKAQKSFADVPLDRATQYAAEDADVTLRLAKTLYPRLEQEKLTKLCLDVEMPLVQVLADMEYAGVSIDTTLLAQMSKELGDKLADLSNRIRAAAGVEFNHDSPKQLGDVLFNKLKLPVIKKTKTGPSTDIEVLEELSDRHPVPALIVEYRQLTKLRSTYLETLGKQVNPRTRRVHASFNQTVAATGRLSSSDPNLQNIPVKTELGRQIRRAFVPADKDHLLLTADYSQIELRMLAHYCQDPALLRAFAEEKDVHRVVAAEIFAVSEAEVTPQQRSIAKTVNFGIIYGQTGFGLSKVLHIPQSQATDFISAYKKRFPQIERFSQECIRQASLNGYVATILGRRRAIPDINSPVASRRQFGQRAAMNSVIQGSAADLIKLAMVNLHRELVGRPDEAKLIMQIHDELVLEVQRSAIEAMAALMRDKMEHAMELRVPLKVDIAWGENWLEGKG